MIPNLQDTLVIGISSRALFDLEMENEIFETKGVEAYRQHQVENENQILAPGTAFPLVKALLSLNDHDPDRRLVEVIVMSQNSTDTGLRVFHSIEHYGLDIQRAAFTSSAPLTPYLQAFQVDLFLSRSPEDVQAAAEAGFAAAMPYDIPEDFNSSEECISFAFDADAVLFSEEAERIYQEQGLEAFVEHERENAMRPLPEGPFAPLLKSLSYLQNSLDANNPAIRIALVTARNGQAYERVARTLREWNVRIDESFFLGGLPKEDVLHAFKAHIFFDDQHCHLAGASKRVPAARVPSPWRSNWAH